MVVMAVKISKQLPLWEENVMKAMKIMMSLVNWKMRITKFVNMNKFILQGVFYLYFLMPVLAYLTIRRLMVVFYLLGKIKFITLYIFFICI